MSVNASKRLLVGRTITGFDTRKFRADRHGTVRAGTAMWAHNPIITLDNGATLTFSVEETEHGDYGVRVFYSKPSSMKTAKKGTDK